MSSSILNTHRAKINNWQVAGIWVEGNDNISTYERSIVVYGRSDYPTQIQPYEGCYDPLSYPLLFPNGEPGWHAKIARAGVSINEVVVAEEDIDAHEEGIIVSDIPIIYYVFVVNVYLFVNTLPLCRD